jgi:hypothetical protein
VFRADRAVAATAILPGSASAAVLTVCTAGPPTCQFATISAAVAASADGDVILIGLGGSTGVTVAAGADVIIRRLTITHATGPGLANDGTLVVRQSVISENGSANPNAGGILNTGTLTLNDVTVLHNKATARAGSRTTDRP